MYEPDEEYNWIMFDSAALYIQEQLGVSQAEAQAKLRRSCADEKIRSMRAPVDPNWEPSLGVIRPIRYVYDPLEKPRAEPEDKWFSTQSADWQRISAREWRDREVDYDADNGKIDVMINEADFWHWFDQQPANREAKTKSSSNRPRDVVKQAINALWPGGIPKELMNKTVVKLVCDKLAKDCKQKGLPLLVVSGDTILRAAGRK
jgi:hypothetical protein